MILPHLSVNQEKHLQCEVHQNPYSPKDR